MAWVQRADVDARTYTEDMSTTAETVERGALVIPAGKVGAAPPSPGRALANSPAGRVRHWRARLLASVSEGDVEAVYRSILAAALDRSGLVRDQLAAARLLLEYVVGKPEAVSDPPAGGPGGGGFVFQFSGPVIVAPGGVAQEPPAAGLPAPVIEAVDQAGRSPRA